MPHNISWLYGVGLHIYHCRMEVVLAASVMLARGIRLSLSGYGALHCLQSRSILLNSVDVHDARSSFLQMQIVDGLKKTGHILSFRGIPSEITTPRI